MATQRSSYVQFIGQADAGYVDVGQRVGDLDWALRYDQSVDVIHEARVILDQARIHWSHVAKNCVALVHERKDDLPREMENLEVVVKRCEALEHNKIDPFAEVLAEDHQWETPLPSELLVGRFAAIREIMDWFIGFSDYELRILLSHRLHAENTVLAVWLAWGINTGPFKGHAPTGRFVEFVGASTFQVVDGLISHTKDFYDVDSLAQQLGLDVSKEASSVEFDSPTGSGQVSVHPPQLVWPPQTEGGVQMNQLETSLRETIEYTARDYNQNLSKEVKDPKVLQDLKTQYYKALCHYYVSQALGENDGKHARQELAYLAAKAGLPVLQGNGLPEVLVTVQEAIELFPELPYGTVTRWLSVGRLKERGRLWGTTKSTRGSPLISLADVAYLRENRPPTGRPLKERRQTRRKT